VTEAKHIALLPHATESVQVWSKSGSHEGHFTPKDETVFRPVSPRIAVGVTQIS
jgi:hypothetical protein